MKPTLEEISQSLSACLETLKAEYNQDVAEQIALHKKSALQYAKYKVGDIVRNNEKVIDVLPVFTGINIFILYALGCEENDGLQIYFILEAELENK